VHHPNNNPETNVLPNGLDEEQIIEAVRVSGYPLQTVVYEKLSSKFHIQEEWNFVDSDSNEERAIDLLAQLDERLALPRATSFQPSLLTTLKITIQYQGSSTGRQEPYSWSLRKACNTKRQK